MSGALDVSRGTPSDSQESTLSLTADGLRELVRRRERSTIEVAPGSVGRTDVHGPRQMTALRAARDGKSPIGGPTGEPS